MKTIVNEPPAIYQKTSNWLPNQEISVALNVNSGICRIENNTVYFYNSNLFLSDIYDTPVRKFKTKLSHLRGRMTKQSEEEINDQLSSLRDEWERNI